MPRLRPVQPCLCIMCDKVISNELNHVVLGGAHVHRGACQREFYARYFGELQKELCTHKEAGD